MRSGWDNTESDRVISRIIINHHACTCVIWKCSFTASDQHHFELNLVLKATELTIFKLFTKIPESLSEI